MNGEGPAPQDRPQAPSLNSQTVPNETPLDAALSYAARGWHVLPWKLEGTTKRPLISAWQINASKDESTIREWWSQMPDAQVGICAGLSGLVVVDIDNKNGVNGFDSMVEYFDGHELMFDDFRDEAGAVSTTRSGGQHLWFSLAGIPDGVKRAVGWLDGVDMLVGPSFIAAPGSAGYEWERPPSDEMPELPPRLQRDLEQRARDQRSSNVDHIPVEPWPEGRRDNELFRYLAGLRGQYGMSEGALRMAAHEANRERCRPPLDHEEVETKVRQVLNYEPGDRAALTDSQRTAMANLLATTRANEDRDPWEPLDWSTMSTLPPPRWLVEGAWPETGMALLVGQSGGGKSFVAIDLMLKIANGLDWFGHKVVRPGAGVYVAMEDFGGLPERMRAWKALAGNDADLDRLYALDAPPLTLNSTDSLAELQSAVERLPGPPVVVVVDTQAMATPGVEENSNKDMGQVAAFAKELARSLDCLVVLVHHTGHAETGRARGASAMHAAADAVIVVEDRTVRATKLKSAEPWGRQAFGLTPGPGTKSVAITESTLGELAQPAFERMRSEEQPIIDALAEHGELSMKKLSQQERVPSNKATCEKLVRKLEAEGRVVVTERPINSAQMGRYVSLVGPDLAGTEAGTL